MSNLNPTSNQEVSNLFSGASGSIGSSVNKNSNAVAKGNASIGGYDDIVQRRKDNSSIAKLDNNLRSLLLGKKKTSTTTTINSTKDKRIAKTSKDNFLKEWKRHCTSAHDTLIFLSRQRGDSDSNTNDNNNNFILQPNEICKEYFSIDIDSEIIGDVVEALYLLVTMTNETTSLPSNSDEAICSASNVEADVSSNCNELAMTGLFSSQLDNISFIRNWLNALTSCGRFELNVSFLMPDEQMKLKKIVNFLKELNESSKDILLIELLLQYDFLLK